jgi:hypothetical protein
MSCRGLIVSPNGRINHYSVPFARRMASSTPDTDDGQHRAKLFLVNQARALLDICHEGYRIEVPMAVRAPSDKDFRPRSARLVHQFNDSIELPFVLNRSEHVGRIHAIAHVHAARNVNQGVADL